MLRNAYVRCDRAVSSRFHHWQPDSVRAACSHAPPAFGCAMQQGTYVMAYLSFNAIAEGGSAGFAPVLASAPAATVADFSLLEWQVVHLARRDTMASLRPPGRWTRLHRLIFGDRPSPVLASGRLEALRHIAVEGWHRGHALHPARIAAFHAAGFTESHLERLLAVISAMRGAPKTRSFA